MEKETRLPSYRPSVLNPGCIADSLRAHFKKSSGTDTTHNYLLSASRRVGIQACMGSSEKLTVGPIPSKDQGSDSEVSHGSSTR